MNAPPISQPRGEHAWPLCQAVSQSGPMKTIIPLAVLLAACNQAPAPPAANQDADSASAPAAPAPPPAAKPFAFDVENDLVEYHYGWSAEAAAVPELAARFAAAMEKDRAELIASAKEDKASRAKDGFPFHPYSSSTQYDTAGQSPGLLSLSVAVSAYTGGAHGNFGTSGLLWDRLAKKEVAITDLFDPPARLPAIIGKPWCDALNIQRVKKREEQPRPGEMFWDCPKLSEIAIVPTDKNANGRFERLVLTASPYVAGPYVEGEYEVELPVRESLIAALKPEFRESFEAQPQ